jgi:hypothetical protein
MSTGIIVHKYRQYSKNAMQCACAYYTLQYGLSLSPITITYFTMYLPPIICWSEILQFILFNSFTQLGKNLYFKSHLLKRYIDFDKRSRSMTLTNLSWSSCHFIQFIHFRSSSLILSRFCPAGQKMRNHKSQSYALENWNVFHNYKICTVLYQGRYDLRLLFDPFLPPAIAVFLLCNIHIHSKVGTLSIVIQSYKLCSPLSISIHSDQESPTDERLIYKYAINNVKSAKTNNDWIGHIPIISCQSIPYEVFRN